MVVPCHKFSPRLPVDVVAQRDFAFARKIDGSVRFGAQGT